METKPIKSTAILIIMIILAGGLACQVLSKPISVTSRPSPKPAITTSGETNVPFIPEKTESGVNPPSFTPTITPAFPGVLSESFNDLNGDPRSFSQSIDKNDGLHAVMGTENLDGDTNAYGIFYIYKAAGESAWAEPVEIYRGKSTEQASEPVIVRLVVDDQGRPYIIWLKSSQLQVAERQPDGKWQAQVLFDQAYIIRFPGAVDIAVGSRNQVVVAWIEGTVGIFTSIKEPGGEWSARQQIYPDKQFNGVFIRLASDKRGNLHMIVSGYTGIYYGYQSAGGSWSDSEKIAGKTESDPLMAVDSSDTVHIVWWSDISVEYHFWYIYKPTGGTWVKKTPIPVQITRLEKAFLTVLNGKDLVLVWVDRGVESDSYLTNLSIKQSGSNWSEAVTIPEPEKYYSPFSLTVCPGGQLCSFWCFYHGFSSETIYVEIPMAGFKSSSLAMVPSPSLPAGLVESLVRGGPGERRDLAIGSRAIVWSEKGAQDWDIWAYDLTTKEVFAVSTGPGDQVHPATSGNMIVWDDQNPTLPRIKGYNLDTKQEFFITSGDSPQWQPDIDGDLVVFEDWRKTGTCSWGDSLFGPGYSCDWDIWAVNLKTKQEFPITQGPETQGDPQVSGNWVIWSEKTEGNDDYYAYQVDSSNPPLLIGMHSDSGPQNPDFNGNIVVWELYLQETNIYGFSLVSQQEFPIAVGSGSKSDPDIWGNIVVWRDSSLGDDDIFAYNLANGQEFPVCMAMDDQENPVISGDVVAWLDMRHDYTEIYMANLPGMNGPQTQTVKPAIIPTSTPTPIPSPTPVPVLPPPPVLISPPEGSVVDSLHPFLRFKIENPDVSLGLGMVYYILSEDEEIVQINCSYQIDSNTFLHTCSLLEDLKPGKLYRWHIEVFYSACTDTNTGDVCIIIMEWAFTTPSQ